MAGTAKNRADLYTDLDTLLSSADAFSPVLPENDLTNRENFVASFLNLSDDSLLLGLKEFSTLRDYANDEVVIYSNVLYQANTNVKAGAWDAGEWDAIPVGGGGDLQDAYDAAEDIVTSVANGALKIYEGTSVGGNLLELYDDSLAEVFSVGVDGAINAAVDKDVVFNFGRFAFTYSTGDQAVFSHIDHATATGYAFKQNVSGHVYFNTPSGTYLSFRVGASDIFRVYSTYIDIVDGKNFQTGTSTGSKFATSASQKIAFYGASPIVQPAHISDPSGGAVIDAECRAAVVALLAQHASLGLQAAS